MRAASLPASLTTSRVKPLAASSPRALITAASQATELLDGLHVDTGRMASVVKQQASALLAERRSLAALSDATTAPESDFDPAHYLGTTQTIIDTILERAGHGSPHPEDDA